MGLRDRTIGFDFGAHTAIAQEIGGFSGTSDAINNGWIHMYFNHGEVQASMRSKRQMRQLINAVHDISQGTYEVMLHSAEPKPNKINRIELRMVGDERPAQYAGIEELEMAEEKIRKEVVSESSDISEKDRKDGVSDFTDVGSEHYANYSASHVRPKRKIKTFGGVKSPNRAKLSRKLDEALEVDDEEIEIVKNGIDTVIAGKLAALGFEFTMTESSAHGTNGKCIVSLENGQWKAHGEVSKEVYQIIGRSMS